MMQASKKYIIESILEQTYIGRLKLDRHLKVWTIRKLSQVLQEVQQMKITKHACFIGYV